MLQGNGEIAAAGQGASRQRKLGPPLCTTLRSLERPSNLAAAEKKANEYFK